MTRVDLQEVGFRIPDENALKLELIRMHAPVPARAPRTFLHALAFAHSDPSGIKSLRSGSVFKKPATALIRRISVNQAQLYQYLTALTAKNFNSLSCRIRVQPWLRLVRRKVFH